ncbi:MAG TPA: TRAP transporter large permease [Burkholderiales bacterium]|nr:TRAP transporter large permease [Burkholderiales bacterium]
MMLAAMMLVLLVFTLLGMEIAWAIALSCFAYIALSQFTDNPTQFALFAQQMTVGLDSFVLVSVPLFIFAGELMNVCGVTQRLVRVAAVLVGHMHGGLANVGVVANFLMSGISGSAVADAAATGTVLVPEMKKRNFPGDFACAVIACAATVGPIIPPSIAFLLLASIINISVGQLFLAGIVPGFLMFIAMFVVTWWLCKRRNYPREARATGEERRTAFRDGVLALIAPAVIVGSIVGGIATPTESAAIAVGYTLFLGLAVYRNTTLSAVIHAAGTAAIGSALVMLTVAASQIFAWLAVQERLGELLTSSMLALSDNVYVMLLLVNLLMLLLGMFMELVPIMFILAPIMFPWLAKMGVSEVQFGVVMVLNLMIGMITPPIGLNLMVLAAITGEDVMRIFRASISYVWALLAVLVAITYIPQLTLFIPQLFYPVK